MKLIIYALLMLSVVSCKKHIEKDLYEDYISPYVKKNDFIVPKNYVVMKSSHTVNALDKERKNSYSTEIFAKFSDEEGGYINKGQIQVGDIMINPDKNNFYEYHGAERLFGTASQSKSTKGINVNFGQNENLLKYDSQLPSLEELLPVNVPNFPTSVLDKNSNLPLFWNPDPNNEFHKVQIQIDYLKDISKYFNSTYPATIQSVIYTIDDNGYFVIPKTELYRFPVGTYVRVSIARASTNNTGDVAYLTIVDAHTIPLIVLANPPLSATFSLTTTNTNPCNFSATAYATGGKPGYGYIWSTYIGTNNQNATEIGYDVWVSGSGNCSTNFTKPNSNVVPSDGPNDMYLQLKVTDANSNSVVVVKKLKFSSGTGGGGGGGGDDPIQGSKK